MLPPPSFTCRPTGLIFIRPNEARDEDVGVAEYDFPHWDEDKDAAGANEQHVAAPPVQP